MQQTTYPDGSTEITFHSAATQDELERKLNAAAAMARSHGAVEVTQRIVDPYGPCPCGSGNKYKFCCRNKER